MKKVIFISALAIAAAVSCTKSDIVDTKFGNDVIGFQTYLGRSAQTKATPVESETALRTSAGIGVYGFYTGKDGYTAATSVANLWANENVYWGDVTVDGVTTKAWTYATTKYWANDNDKYTFLAYAPYNHTTLSDISAGEDVVNPTITYTVPQTPLSAQQDLLYAKEQGTAADYKTSGVTLNMKHALARLTVTAMAPTDANGFQFDVKEVTISGKFNTTGTLYLATAEAGDENTDDAGWDATASTTDVVYSFYNNYAPSYDETTKKWDVLPVGSDAAPAVNYAFVEDEANNYLMMIPTKFTEANKATLSVTYTTIYENQESQPVTKELPIVMDFRMGKAYAINLNFSHTATPITFNVSVAEWGPETPVTSTGAGKNNPEDYAAKTPEQGA